MRDLPAAATGAEHARLEGELRELIQHLLAGNG